MTGSSTFANGTLIESGGSLTSPSAFLTGAIDDEGILTVAQDDDADFAATLSGAGQFIKSGSGTLTLGDQMFAGATTVAAGTLMLSGAMPSAVTVGNGGTLAGTGRIASLTVESGGQLSLGNAATGTLNVSGDLVQKSGSSLLVTLAADRTAPILAVDGAATIENGATLSLAPDTAAALIGSHYTLVTASNGITGSYDFVALPGSGLELRLTQGSDAIIGLVARQGSALGQVATSTSGAAVAPALAALGLSSQAYTDLTLDPSDARVVSALTALSGDFHPSVQTAMVHDALLFENQVQAHLATGSAAQHSTFWGQILALNGRDKGAAGASDLDRRSFAVMTGLDLSMPGVAQFGLVGGYTRTRLEAPDGSAHGTIKSGHVSGYFGTHTGPLSVHGGVGYSWSKIGTTRNVVFDSFNDQDHAAYDGHMLDGFGEVAYAMPLGAVTLTPFARVTVVHVHSDAFAETGGESSLAGDPSNRTASFGDLGDRIALRVGQDVNLAASVALEHALGHVQSWAKLHFLAGTDAFEVPGTVLPRNTVRPTLDLVFRPRTNVAINLGYAGGYGSGNHESSGRVGLTLAL